MLHVEMIASRPATELSIRRHGNPGPNHITYQGFDQMALFFVEDCYFVAIDSSQMFFLMSGGISQKNINLKVHGQIS